MDFYSCLIILTCLMMLAMTLHVLRYSGFTKSQKVWYVLTFISITVCAVAEFAVHSGYYKPSLAPLLTAVTVIQFSVAPVLAVLFSGALGLANQSRFAALLFSVNFTVEAVCSPFGWIFYFDNEGYHRGELFIIYEAFFFLSLVYLIVSLILVGRKFKHRDVFTIGMVIVIIVAGILPMIIFRLNVTYIAIAISSSLCYIYYNDLVQQDIKQELVTNQKKISDMQGHMISGLASVIENRDTNTGEHIYRTSSLVKAIAECARRDGVYVRELDDRFVTLLYTLAPLHDIGKILISDRILNKPGKLTPDEYEQMKEHAAKGGDVVRQVLSGITDEEYLSFASDIATYHHERWDGTGYPQGLRGNEIPLSARIMAIADVYDALVSERCYKSAMSPDEAFEIIRDGAGTHFDPKLTGVFLEHREEFEAAGKGAVIQKNE